MTKLSDPHAYCLFLLGLRLRTEGEIREKLQKRGYAEDTVVSEIEELKQNGYLNDERFAENFTENMKKYKPYGFYQVKKKLMEKRLPAALITQALDELFTLDDELSVAKRFLKKDPTFTKRDFETKQKIARRLKNRGFRAEIIAKLIA